MFPIYSRLEGVLARHDKEQTYGLERTIPGRDPAGETERVTRVCRNPVSFRPPALPSPASGPRTFAEATPSD